MTTSEKTTITVEATVQASPDLVWELWTNPLHITQWNYASPDWHTPRAENDLRPGGKLSSRMEARDGSFGFDFEGIYDAVEEKKHIAYTIADGRRTDVTFRAEGDATHITETFEAENTNPAELQKGGWQSILNTFKKYAEYAAEFQPQHYSIVISAPREKVWKTMLEPETYVQWTNVSWPGSRYEGTWAAGETLKFVGETGGGTKAILRDYRENEFALAEHIAILEDGGTEDTESAGAKSWIGSREVYFLREKDGKTVLDTLMYLKPAWKDMFTEDWPKAMKKIKELSENS